MSDSADNPGALPPELALDPYLVIAVKNLMEQELPANADIQRYLKTVRLRAAALLGSVGAFGSPGNPLDNDDIIRRLQTQYGLALGLLLHTPWVQVYLVPTVDVDALLSRYPGAEVLPVVPERGDTGGTPYLRLNGVGKNTLTYRAAAPFMNMKNIRLHRLILALARCNLNNPAGTPYLYRLEVHHKDGNVFNNHWSNLEIVVKYQHLKIHVDLDPGGTGFRKEALIHDQVLDRMKVAKGMFKLVVVHTPADQHYPIVAMGQCQLPPDPVCQEGDQGVQERQVGPGAPGHGQHEVDCASVPDSHHLPDGFSHEDRYLGDHVDGAQGNHGGHGQGIDGGEVHSRNYSITAVPTGDAPTIESTATVPQQKQPGIASFRRSGRSEKRAKGMHMVYRHLVKLGSPAPFSAIECCSSSSSATIRRLLDDLIADGFVAHESHGPYSVVTPAPLVPNVRRAAKSRARGRRHNARAAQGKSH